jgi:outer membrane protein assembly factor BamB
MGKLDLECGNYRITLEDTVALAPLPGAGPAARSTVLDSGTYVPSSVVQVTATHDGSEVWSTTLTSSGGGTAVRDTSVLCLGTRVAVLIGPYVVALDTATGEMAWRQQCDPATCFGIYRVPGGRGLISHGEQQIVRLAEDGSIEWRFDGKDVFTGPFEVAPEGIIATDFKGDVYAISFDGQLQATAKGKPFPH